MSFSTKLKMVLVAAALSASATYAVSFTMGGTIQTINSLTAVGEQQLDFTSPATFTAIATLTISNNTDSYDLNLKFTNSGQFLKPSAALGTGVTMTAIRVRMLTPAATTGAGGWGTAIASLVPGVASSTPDAVNSLITAEANNVAGWTWNPADQTTSTVGGVLKIEASWLASTKLAGAYSETCTALLTSTIN